MKHTTNIIRTLPFSFHLPLKISSSQGGLPLPLHETSFRPVPFTLPLWALYVTYKSQFRNQSVQSRTWRYWLKLWILSSIKTSPPSGIMKAAAGERARSASCLILYPGFSVLISPSWAHLTPVKVGERWWRSDKEKWNLFKRYKSKLFSCFQRCLQMILSCVDVRDSS